MSCQLITRNADGIVSEIDSDNKGRGFGEHEQRLKPCGAVRGAENTTRLLCQVINRFERKCKVNETHVTHIQLQRRRVRLIYTAIAKGKDSQQ